jgi:biotin carboxyl carrier protein
MGCGRRGADGQYRNTDAQAQDDPKPSPPPFHPSHTRPSQPTPVAAHTPNTQAGAVSMAEAIEVFMPALSSTMTEGKIVEWTVKVGDKVKAGDTIMVVESDKVRVAWCAVWCGVVWCVRSHAPTPAA